MENKFLVYNGNRCCENKIYTIEDQVASCGCADGSSNAFCYSDSADDNNTTTDNCQEVPKKNLIDYDKDAIRDDLMEMRGGVLLLREQNRGLLNELNCSVTLLLRRKGTKVGFNSDKYRKGRPAIWYLNR